VSAAFRGFGPEVFEWFDGLERDNSRAYFTATRELFEREVRGQVEAMLDELRGEFGGEVRMFRQNRDVRFSADKSPYKTRTYGVLHGRGVVGAGLYASLSAHGVYAGSGYHQMARDQLARYRGAVASDETGPALVAAADAAVDAGFDVDGQGLRTAPRGYPRDHPRIELLRKTSLVAGGALPAGDGIGREAALDHVARAWRAAGPLTAWLHQHVGPSLEPPDERGRRRR